MDADMEHPEVVKPADEVKEVKEDKPTPKPAAPVITAPKTSITNDAVVSLKALIPHGLSKNSASVRVVQQRLLELGHLSAGADLSGWLSTGTVEALTEYADKAKVKSASVVDRAVIESLLKGTPAKLVA